MCKMGILEECGTHLFAWRNRHRNANASGKGVFILGQCLFLFTKQAEIPCPQFCDLLSKNTSGIPSILTLPLLSLLRSSVVL